MEEIDIPLWDLTDPQVFKQYSLNQYKCDMDNKIIRPEWVVPSELFVV
jgi:hypothetical protein